MKAIPLNPTLGRRSPRPVAAAPPRAVLAGVFAVIREWRRRARGRAELAALDDRTLRDIGVSRGDIRLEIDKPFLRK
jgi:uncharacterized protein YjiS (DUF1127 family)